jgi:hypothetical protein
MKHFYQNIEGWFNFQGIYKGQVQIAKDNAHFVEVGAWLGKSTSFMAVEIINSGKNIRFDVVDTWKGSTEHWKHPVIQKYGSAFPVFQNNIKPVQDKCHTIQKPSIEASKLYEDESLDFVFIDAAHDYENVKNDIQSWLPKIKIGGTLAGHDFHFQGVRRAVKELLKHFDIYRNSWIFTKYHVSPQAPLV